MPGFVFCSLKGRGCEKVGWWGEIIEDKQVKTEVNFEFLAFWDAVLVGGELSTPVSL